MWKLSRQQGHSGADGIPCPAHAGQVERRQPRQGCQRPQVPDFEVLRTSAKSVVRRFLRGAAASGSF